MCFPTTCALVNVTRLSRCRLLCTHTSHTSASFCLSRPCPRPFQPLFTRQLLSLFTSFMTLASTYLSWHLNRGVQSRPSLSLLHGSVKSPLHLWELLCWRSDRGEGLAWKRSAASTLGWKRDQLVHFNIYLNEFQSVSSNHSRVGQFCLGVVDL